MDAKQITNLVAGLRQRFDSGCTRPLSWRQEQLSGLRALLREREGEIQEALRADLGRPMFESLILDIESVDAEIKHAQRHLGSWVKARGVATPLVAQPGKSRVVNEPLGVVLIIAPWNFPIYLTLDPLIGAVAAGNCTVIKPSEMAPRSSEVLARWLPAYVDDSCIRVVEGAVPETTALLAERFDHIFYTGSAAVGRIVMSAAAKHLTPVTLELGGKNPCIVDRKTDLVVAARRIAQGKFLNAGQCCVAPDYVLAHRDVHENLLARLKKTLHKFYGPDPKQSPDYSRIVNKRHFERLAPMLQDGEAVSGGDADADNRYIAPTVLRDVDPESSVMEGEIFGPILPVLEVDSIDAAISFINARPKPLALYLFSNDSSVQDQVVRRTSSGAVTINHFWLHMAVLELPFGGVGESGMGAYHGSRSFKTFSHQKALLTHSTVADPSLLYPPYNPKKLKWVRRIY